MPGKKPRVPDGPPDNVSYPTARDFFFVWTEGMASPWNQRSLSIVYKYVMQKHEDEKDDFIHHLGVDEIQKKIKKHGEYLKRLWMQQHEFTERDLELYNLAHSNYTRRRAVSHFYLSFVRLSTHIPAVLAPIGNLRTTPRAPQARTRL